MHAVAAAVARVLPLVREAGRMLAEVPPIVKPDGSPVTVGDYAAQAVQKWANVDGETLDWAPMPDSGEEEAIQKAMEARIAAAKKWLAKLK